MATERIDSEEEDVEKLAEANYNRLIGGINNDNSDHNDRTRLKEDEVRRLHEIFRAERVSRGTENALYCDTIRREDRIAR